MTEVCKICTSTEKAILSKLRSIFAWIWPEKQLISRLVPALWETLELLNGFVNYDGLITVMTSVAVTSATNWPVTWLLLSNHQLMSPRQFAQQALMNKRDTYIHRKKKCPFSNSQKALFPNSQKALTSSIVCLGREIQVESWNIFKNLRNYQTRSFHQCWRWGHVQFLWFIAASTLEAK